MSSSDAAPFLQYHEPEIVDILILVSFFTFLWISEYVSAKLLRAGIIGPVVVGIIYGEPLANLLHRDWAETFLYLGYIGLVLIIFEGGLSTRLDLLKANFTLSICGAATGVLCPIGFSYLLLYLGFGYGAVETFIIGAALSATSLGTTFAVIAGASKDVDLSQTKVGAVLVSAAVIDDVTGLVMSSVIHDLGSIADGGNVNLGWLIGRPIVASAAMAILTPVLTKWVFAPLFRRYIEKHFHRFDHISNIMLMIFVLSAFISIAAYAGTSILFGAFLAGAFLTYLPSTHPEGPFVVMSREEGERSKDKSPTFVHTFECYCLDAQQYVLAPLFFASIGFAIPFLDLWTGEAIWKGVVYTLLMLAGKAIVGLWIPLWATIQHDPKKARESQQDSVAENGQPLEKVHSSPYSPTRKAALQSATSPAILLGMAMVARGEIGLLIVEIGYNNTPYVTSEGFLTAIWAILLNTIIGPVCVGLVIKYKGEKIGKGPWGLVPVGRNGVLDRMLVEQTFSTLVLVAKLVNVARYRYSLLVVNVGSSSGDGKRHTAKRTQQMY
ncbi:KefB Kef-type K+ transport systems membrane component [Pyrenophora tritici-repentis]|nr:KefB Kef-type K+ transport systems membrane component [Pyrenophora tritici-repentis]KAI1545173.1 KefB Kef-type K+ transport systems membrane component [Pyrenophora tritici-repentis]KAI1599610.1 KefB Kef-type K+ transport systems membrane component [Pyrenophora tritici-repentis]